MNNNKKKEPDNQPKDTKKGMIVDVSRTSKWKGLKVSPFLPKK